MEKFGHQVDVKIVFTDRRLPKWEIWSWGRVTFNVIYDGEEIDCFTCYENDSYEISGKFAKQKAIEHFNEIYKNQQLGKHFNPAEERQV
jgi:hypothetical protein